VARAYEGPDAPGRQLQTWVTHRAAEIASRLRHRWNARSRHRKLVEDNDVVDCGWQDAEFHWEVAGIKLLGCRGTLVRNNHVARIQGGDAIWLDFGNQNSRVTEM